MRNKKFINVGIHLSAESIDLQIPNQVTINRLKVLLKAALINSSYDIPDTFDLIVLNKPIRLNEDNLLSDYPLGDGDQLLLKKIKKVRRKKDT